ncbi:MAG: PQQ-binding-like beta-propeller repeat protein [Gemmataceae bacterium]|nr:PQQ-binding-like beta-propeller repeat protein [Gemmataceae bacterium]
MMMRCCLYLSLLASAAGCGRCCDGPPVAPAAAAACCEIDRGRAIAFLADEKTANAPWPLFGGSVFRNMANTVDKNIPIEWSLEEGKQKNIKWIATVGQNCYGGPVVAGGKVIVGTTNDNPRDPAIKGRRAVLMAFRESDGQFLWQIAHEYPPDEIFREAISSGLVSTPVIDGDRLYYVTPACEVIAATMDGKIVWRFDMMKELKVVPFHCGNCSPLVAGNLLVLITSNGVGEEHKVASPKAPSFLALDKNDGKVVWQSNLPGDEIIEGQWSNPSLARVNGQDQVIFPGGDAYLYGLELATGKLIWKMNCQPERDPKGEDRDKLNYFVSTAVVHGHRAYIGLGHAPETGRSTPFSHFLCVDITKKGDVSPKTLDHNDPANKGSALVWSYGGPIKPTPKKGRRVRFGSTMGTCALHDGLVYITEERGYFYCLDAQTGEKYWDYDFRSSIWGSPYYVDGKVYVGSEDAEVVVFEHGKKLKILARNDMGEQIHTTPVAANGVLYVTTRGKLVAIAEKK